MNAPTDEVIYDPFTPENWPDPIPAYSRLIRDFPVYYLQKRDMWILSRYDDIISASKNWQVFSSGRGGNSLIDINFPDRVGNSLGTSDPPKHTQLRRIIGDVFTPRYIAGLEPDMREIALDLIAKFKDKRQFDAQWEFANPFTAKIIGVMIGVPEKEMNDFVEILGTLIRASSEQKDDPSFIPSQLKIISGYCAQLVEKKMQNPGKDIISKLIGAEVDGQKFTPREIGITAMTLIGAAFQSAGLAIGCSMATLAKHPEQLAEVYADRSLIPQMIEEALRYDGTTIGFIRTTTEDVELHGQVIPEGSRVFLCYGAANHDPKYFPNPEKFDIHRENNKHLGFGMGIHTCLGAPMARLMMKVAFEELLPVLGDKYTVDHERSVLSSAVQFRGYNHLYIHF